MTGYYWRDGDRIVVWVSLDGAPRASDLPPNAIAFQPTYTGRVVGTIKARKIRRYLRRFRTTT